MMAARVGFESPQGCRVTTIDTDNVYKTCEPQKTGK
jgi:hypothetical protein